MASPARVVELLEAIDGLPDSASGALLFRGDDERGGAVLVEQGRVCWAMAPGMQRRLTDLIAANLPDGFGPQDLAEVFRSCQSTKKPLGEALVELGVMRQETFRQILLQQTAAAIDRLCDEHPHARRWRSHSRSRYDATFTFSPVELLAATGASLDPKLAEVAATQLKSGAPEGVGVAYARLAGCAGLYPVAEVRCDELGVHGMLELGRWAASTLDLSDAFAQRTRIVMAARPDGQSIVAWRYHGLLFAVVCPDRSVAAWIVAKQNRDATEPASGEIELGAETSGIDSSANASDGSLVTAPGAKS